MDKLHREEEAPKARPTQRRPRLRGKVVLPVVKEEVPRRATKEEGQEKGLLRERQPRKAKEGTGAARGQGSRGRLGPA